MNNQSQIDCITDASLDKVSGGMSCDAAQATASVFFTFGDILAGLGKAVESAKYYGKADGIVRGGCH